MERSEDPDLTADNRPEPNPPGRQLRKAREAMGMGVADVAATLRLSVATIDNLEQDRYDRLPPDTFVRGYLRAYGRLLQLDAEALVQAFDQGSGGPAPRPLRASKPVQTAPDLSLGMKYMLPLALVGGVLVFAAIWGVELYRGLGQSDSPDRVALETVEQVNDRLEQLLQRTDPEARERRSPGQRADEPEDLAARGGDLAGGGAHETAAVEGSLSLSEFGAPPVPVRISALDSELERRAELADEAAAEAGEAEQDQADATDNQTDAADNNAMEAAEANGAALVIRFDGPSWVEVRDNDGERLLYGLVENQETHRLRGTPPFSLVFGDVGQVSVELDGETVDLGDQRPGRVARLRVPSD
ncbi:DUF4115 domain-containing protein [Methylonatrum kenyense]|uniref:RodZ domain-containing protein n=1 Tax=Methylonatrum kenyense TaxID=455253 RepID=UPI0020C0B31A|nr:RodZ domain-containing protein [Methylonatrum kenyense]MCK8515551.1 DUF4115 domain-containing protein [Methylonatrum kenyense]